MGGQQPKHKISDVGAHRVGMDHTSRAKSVMANHPPGFKDTNFLSGSIRYYQQHSRSRLAEHNLSHPESLPSRISDFVVTGRSWRFGEFRQHFIHFSTPVRNQLAVVGRQARSRPRCPDKAGSNARGLEAKASSPHHLGCSLTVPGMRRPKHHWLRRRHVNRHGRHIG